MKKYWLVIEPKVMIHLPSKGYICVEDGPVETVLSTFSFKNLRAIFDWMNDSRIAQKKLVHFELALRQKFHGREEISELEAQSLIKQYELQQVRA